MASLSHTTHTLPLTLPPVHPSRLSNSLQCNEDLCWARVEEPLIKSCERHGGVGVNVARASTSCRAAALQQWDGPHKANVWRHTRTPTAGSKAHLPGRSFADRQDILLESEDFLVRSHWHSLFQEGQVLGEHVVLLEQLVQRHRDVAEARQAKEAMCDGKRWRMTQPFTILTFRGTPASCTSTGEMCRRHMLHIQVANCCTFKCLRRMPHIRTVSFWHKQPKILACCLAQQWRSTVQNRADLSTLS